MTATANYLDQIKAKLAIPSDNRLAEYFKVSRQRIAEYRRGDTAFSDERCLQLAAILEIDPAAVLLTIHAERARKAGRYSIGAIFDALLLKIRPRDDERRRAADPMSPA